MNDLIDLENFKDETLMTAENENENEPLENSMKTMLRLVSGGSESDIDLAFDDVSDLSALDFSTTSANCLTLTNSKLTQIASSSSAAATNFTENGNCNVVSYGKGGEGDADKSFDNFLSDVESPWTIPLTRVTPLAPFMEIPQINSQSSSSPTKGPDRSMKQFDSFAANDFKEVEDGEKTPTRNSPPSMLDTFLKDSPNTSPVKTPTAPTPVRKSPPKLFLPLAAAPPVHLDSLKRSATTAASLKRVPTRLRSPSKHTSAFRSKPLVPQSPLPPPATPQTTMANTCKSTPSSPMKRSNHARSSSVYMESTILSNACTTELQPKTRPTTIPSRESSEKIASAASKPGKRSFLPRLKHTFAKLSSPHSSSSLSSTTKK